MQTNKLLYYSSWVKACPNETLHLPPIFHQNHCYTHGINEFAPIYTPSCYFKVKFHMPLSSHMSTTLHPHLHLNTQAQILYKPTLILTLNPFSFTLYWQIRIYTFLSPFLSINFSHKLPSSSPALSLPLSLTSFKNSNPHTTHKQLGSFVTFYYNYYNTITKEGLITSHLLHLLPHESTPLFA